MHLKGEGTSYIASCRYYRRVYVYGPSQRGQYKPEQELPVWMKKGALRAIFDLRLMLTKLIGSRQVSCRCVVQVCSCLESEHLRR